MNLLIFDVFRDFGDILVTSLILGAAMACQWLVIGLLLGLAMVYHAQGWCLLYIEM